MAATVLLFLALGLDTLAVALGLGLSGLPRERWLRVGLTFALFEGFMPVIGVVVGHRLVRSLGEPAGYLAAALLIIIGLLAIKEAASENDAEDDHAPAALPGDPGGRPLAWLGLSVSLDELGVGFSLGVLKTPLGPALSYVALQAFVFTFVGLSLGRRVGARLGERAELVSGIILTLLGIAMLANQAMGARFL
jgi:manganese efflux pump family protein